MVNPPKHFITKVILHYRPSFHGKFFCGVFLFSCIFCLLITSCQKDHVVTSITTGPEDSSAVFNLRASDSACSIPLLNGNFIVGKLLTDSENISIEVVVSKTGKWALSTASLNGFLFAGSGIFADTGKQLITLKAYGTPETVGNYFFSVATESIVRFFPVSVLTGDVQTETVPLKSYFKGTIGGVPYYVEAPTIGPDNISYSPGSGDSASFASFVNPGIYPPPSGSGAISLQKGNLYGYATSTEADFKKFFEPGAYPFSPNQCSNYLFPGIILWWVDSNEEGWGTLKEFGDQQGSSFTIVGIEDGHDNEGKYFVKVKSRFNCKLYNTRTGEMKELTDGELVSFFKK